MSDAGKEQRTLTNDQIRVTENVRSATDVLRSSKPYLEAALRAMQDGGPEKYPTIEVPPYVVRDLVVMLAAEAKRADTIAGKPKGDSGDGDWNPFNGIDFEFD